MKKNPNKQLSTDSKIGQTRYKQLSILNENQKLTHKVNLEPITCFSHIGTFRIYHIDGKYRLHDGEKLIFSSNCLAIVHRNQIEWNYHREKEILSVKKNSCNVIATIKKAISMVLALVFKAISYKGV